MRQAEVRKRDRYYTTDIPYHMMLDGPLKGNVQFRYYPSGYMIYLNPAALH